MALQGYLLAFMIFLVSVFVSDMNVTVKSAQLVKTLKLSDLVVKRKKVKINFIELTYLKAQTLHSFLEDIKYRWVIKIVIKGS